MSPSTDDFLLGVLGLISTASIAAYDPDRIWTADDTDWMLSPGELPPAPDRVVGAQCYTVRDDPHLNDSLLGVQFRIRGAADDRAGVYGVNDALFDLLHGMHDTTIADVGVALVQRQNSMPAGVDDSDRYMHAASFYFAVAWPTTYRTD